MTGLWQDPVMAVAKIVMGKGLPKTERCASMGVYD